MSDDKRSELTPCPFCGRTDLLQTDKMVQEYSAAVAKTLARDGFDAEPEDEWFVVCGDCGAMGPIPPSVEDAQAAWNKRMLGKAPCDMPFRLFYDQFPEVAMAETRTIGLPQSQGGLPAGWYAFKEMFCDEPGCDCRRVFFLVETSFRDGVEVVIAWGWEDLAFYERWMKYGDKDDARELIGPILNPLSPATDLAPHILELFKQVLLPNEEFTERVKRHYDMFREAVEAEVVGTKLRKAPGKAKKGKKQKRKRRR